MPKLPIIVKIIDFETLIESICDKSEKGTVFIVPINEKVVNWVIDD